MPADDVTGHRIEALERDVRRLQNQSVSQPWLDERFGRVNDRLDSLSTQIGEMRQLDRNRRLAVYSAVAIGIVSLVSALVLVAMTLPPGVAT